ncbi:MAG: hypothetical protein O7B27_08320 [Gammaproteobacteria bacterium]|nr:hypothetical protein [Gammaproteobacteria bacterium]
MSDISMQWSDLWVLFSILIGGGQTNDGASLMSAMRAGDGINHAIFTKEELASGFYKLTVEKYIIARNGKYFATEQSKSLYAQAQKNNRSIYKAWDYMGEKMGAERYTGFLPNPANIYKYPGIDRESLALASEQWHKQAQEWLKKS